MNRGSFQQFHLSDMISDELHYTSAAKQYTKEWTIVNNLPTDLVMYVLRRFSNQVTRLGMIKSHGTVKFPAHYLKNNDKLAVFYENGSTKVLMMDKMVLKEWFKNITLGAVEYRSTDGHLQYQASNYDLAGVTIHNKLKVPINIYHNGNLVAQLYADDGMSYLGGSSSILYYSNSRQGLKFGDQLSFEYATDDIKSDSKFLFTVTIDDNQCQSIHVGVVSNGDPPGEFANPDTFAYRIDEPVWTGITYYRPDGRYSSIQTNPYAPF